MKRILHYVLLIAILAPLVILLSCGGDDPAPKILVVAERTTGKLYSVNKSSAARTELGTVTFNDIPLQQLRGMVFNPNDKKLYASSTDDNGGALYTINPETLEATSLNTDPDDDWYGVADLLVSSDNQILATLWHKNPTEVGLAKFNLTGVMGPRVVFSNQDICCGLGMVFGDTKSELIISSYQLEIYSSDLSGTVTLLTTLVPEGFGTTLADDLYIQNMVKDNGKIYAIVYDETLGNTHLAEVDLDNDALIEIGQLNQGNTNRFHALMIVSKSIF